MLAATRNSLITVSVEGADASETMERIFQAFENKFGE
jgi:phosphocarrier protein